MKRLSYLMLCLLLISGTAFAAGTVTQGEASHDADMVTIIFTCVGDSANGTIPDTDTTTANTAAITGMYLYDVEVDPGTSAPDAADVLIKNTGGRDLLDGLGVNLIHATATQSMGDSMPFFDKITGALTLDVDNQATVSATYTVTWIFVK